MTNTVSNTTYFEKPGPENTQTTLKLAKKRAEELKIKNIIIASTSGETAVKATKLFKDHNLTIVTHVTGFTEPNTQELLPTNRKTIENNGATIITAAHAFGTLGRAVTKKFNTIEIDGIISAVFRLFGQGVKVGCEIACMATDAGTIKTDEDVIAIGGTMSGADSALVLKPSNTHALFDLRIREIICKPRL